MIVLKSAFLGAVMATGALQPFASCDTSNSDCGGTATFHNFSPATNCATVRWQGGGFNFCAPGNGAAARRVPPLSRYCWSGGNFAPQMSCNLQWIFVPYPHPVHG